MFLFLCRPEELEAEKEETLFLLRSLPGSGGRSYELVQQFTHMLHERRDGWLDLVNQSCIPLPAVLCSHRVEKDKEAMMAELTWWINNGMVEGM